MPIWKAHRNFRTETERITIPSFTQMDEVARVSTTIPINDGRRGRSVYDL